MPCMRLPMEFLAAQFRVSVSSHICSTEYGVYDCHMLSTCCTTEHFLRGIYCSYSCHASLDCSFARCASAIRYAYYTDAYNRRYHFTAESRNKRNIDIQIRIRRNKAKMFLRMNLTRIVAVSFESDVSACDVRGVFVCENCQKIFVATNIKCQVVEVDAMNRQDAYKHITYGFGLRSACPQIPYIN